MVLDYWKNHSFDYMDLCWQSDVSAFAYAVLVCHSFSSKEQVSFNFVGAVTFHSDFVAQEIISFTVSTFSSSILYEVMGPDVTQIHN